jgi:hypothetical protein
MSIGRWILLVLLIAVGLSLVGQSLRRIAGR